MANLKRLLLTLILAAGYMVAEIVGGLLSNSLALLADAGHMFSDVASLALSVFAIWIAARPAVRNARLGTTAPRFWRRWSMEQRWLLFRFLSFTKPGTDSVTRQKCRAG